MKSLTNSATLACYISYIELLSELKSAECKDPKTSYCICRTWCEVSSGEIAILTITVYTEGAACLISPLINLVQSACSYSLANSLERTSTFHLPPSTFHLPTGECLDGEHIDSSVCHGLYLLQAPRGAERGEWRHQTCRWGETEGADNLISHFTSMILCLNRIIHFNIIISIINY